MRWKKNVKLDHKTGLLRVWSIVVCSFIASSRYRNWSTVHFSIESNFSNKSMVVLVFLDNLHFLKYSSFTNEHTRNNIHSNTRTRLPFFLTHFKYSGVHHNLLLPALLSAWNETRWSFSPKIVLPCVSWCYFKLCRCAYFIVIPNPLGDFHAK